MKKKIIFTLCIVAVIACAVTIARSHCVSKKTTTCGKNVATVCPTAKTDSCTTAKADSCTKDNLVKTAQWDPAADAWGSSFDTTTTPFRTDSAVTTTLTLAKVIKETEWPYVELICKLNGTMEKYNSIEITYTSETPLIVKLSQSDFSCNGNKTYTHYQYRLDPSSSWKTVAIETKDFVQPNWTPEKSKTIGYKGENVTALYFSPEIDATIGGSSKIAIKEILLK